MSVLRIRDESGHFIPIPTIKGEPGIQGETGVTPNITVTAKTGEPGTEVSVVQSGTPENPVVEFTVPRGQDGKHGEPGKDAPQDIVRYNAQTLSPEQQAQARSNIGAVSSADAATKKELEKKLNTEDFTAFVSAFPAATLEKAIEAYYALRRTGKIYGAKIYKFASNPSSSGVRLADAENMTYVPSTDTVAGKDDFIDQVPMFDWVHVNYIRDDDGTARPIAIEGMSNYKTTGAVDVGAMQMSFFVKVVDNPDSIEYYVSDIQHTGFVPWCESVKADGTVLPWCIGSAYLSGIASDGLLRSQPNLMIELWQSHNNMIENYQKKGLGYWGAGVERNTFAILMQYIKATNKSSQATWAGCTNYNIQHPASIESAEPLAYFPLTKAQAANVLVGSTVCVGYGYESNGTINLDRNNANLYKYVKQARVARIEDLDDVNAAVYLDTDTTFTTSKVSLTDALQSPVYLSTYPWASGTTDKVMGKYDGSWLSNTNGKTPYRIQGREYNLGCYEIPSNLVLDCKETGYEVLHAQKGVAHASSDAAIRAAYTKIGTMPVVDGDQQVGDIDVNPTTGAWYITAYGGSGTQGMGDRCYGASGQKGMREVLQRGFLGYGSVAGSAYLHCWGGLGWTHWFCGAGD